jgi:proteasome accessory factor C
LRLTRQEALAVYVRGQEHLAAPGLPEASSLGSALGKLRKALGDEERIEAAVAGTAPPHLEAVREAARTQQRLKIEYLAATTGERSSREIEPEEVFSSLGHWYVAAWDVASDDERLFRVDRIMHTESTGVTFQTRGLAGAGRALYSPTADDVSIRLRLLPPARWVAEYYFTFDPVERDDGSIEVTLPARRPDRLAGLLLRLGNDAAVLDPPGLSEQARELARMTLAAYRSMPSDGDR